MPIMTTIPAYYGNSSDFENFDLRTMTTTVYVDGGDGIDQIITGSGNDVIYGGYESDRIVAQGGDDVIFGDTFADDNRADPGPGLGRFRAGGDTILAGSGADVVFGAGGFDYINGESGDDLIVGGVNGNIPFPFTAFANDGDILFGGYGNDRIIGSAGNDILYGGTPSDFSAYSGRPLTEFGYGEAAPDDMGFDFLDGGFGDDLLVGQGGNDILLGGPGNDTMDGGTGDDSLDGGDGNDVIGGGTGNDVISGGFGNDYVFGAEGNDYITGGSGTDLVFGAQGNDTLFGGPDSDVFYYRGGDGTDLLADFVPGPTADVIDLIGTQFGSFAQVQQSLSFDPSTNSTVLRFNDGNYLIIANVTPSQLDASDFWFNVF